MFLDGQSQWTSAFSAEDIWKITQGLDPNKAHRHDNISIHMLKICVDDISKQLEVILSQVLASGSLPSEWKKVILSSFTKKDE